MGREAWAVDLCEIHELDRWYLYKLVTRLIDRSRKFLRASLSLI